MLNWISIAIKMHLPIGVAKLKVQIDAIFQDIVFMSILQWWIIIIDDDETEMVGELLTDSHWVVVWSGDHKPAEEN